MAILEIGRLLENKAVLMSMVRNNVHMSLLLVRIPDKIRPDGKDVFPTVFHDLT